MLSWQGEWPNDDRRVRTGQLGERRFMDFAIIGLRTLGALRYYLEVAEVGLKVLRKACGGNKNWIGFWFLCRGAWATFSVMHKERNIMRDLAQARSIPYSIHSATKSRLFCLLHAQLTHLFRHCAYFLILILWIGPRSTELWLLTNAYTSEAFFVYVFCNGTQERDRREESKARRIEAPTGGTRTTAEDADKRRTCYRRCL